MVNLEQTDDEIARLEGANSLVRSGLFPQSAGGSK
jgi:hypothetical protein